MEFTEEKRAQGGEARTRVAGRDLGTEAEVH